MRKFFENLIDKIYKEIGVASEVIIHCNNHFKCKIENEQTNSNIVYYHMSNHSNIYDFSLAGYKIKLNVDEKYKDILIEKVN